MDITQTQATGQTSPAAGRSAETNGAATSALSSDFETFLRMMTVQMENQDPLNPIQSSDFAVQLATFSGVEQQVRTNYLLEALAKSLGGSAISQYADWVGREARTTSPVYFDGEPIVLETEPVVDADLAELVVRDESGRAVERVQLPQGGGEVIWEGQSETGEPFLTGLYSFTVESRAGGEVIDERPATSYAPVREVRIGGDGSVELVFDGGATAAPDDVTALRAPSG